MTLKEAFEKVDKEYYKYLAVVLQDDKVIIGNLFLTLRDFPNLYNIYDVLDENKPYVIDYYGGKLCLIFKVKERIIR